MELTKGQQKIVDLRNRDILVAAAAGAGKTATLVERIMKLMTEKENPINIDEVLMVTFSNLAANQMKEKIRKKIDEKLKETPENEHLAKQLVRVNRADISTIDKFCKKIVSENYDKLGIDASFEIAEDGVRSLLQNQVLDKLFDGEYAKLQSEMGKADDGYADFGKLVAFYCMDNSEDQELRKQIIALYNTAMKQPYPMHWLKKVIASLNVKNVKKLEKQSWTKEIVEYQKKMNEAVINAIDRFEDYCNQVGSADDFSGVIKADRQRVEDFNNASSYAQMYSLYEKAGRWKSFPNKKKLAELGYDEETFGVLDQKRKEYKKMANDNKIISSPEQIIEAYVSFRRYYIPLVKLTIRFMQEYDNVKKKKKLYEFADISHMAYGLLCKVNYKGVIVPTEIAKQISKRYKYIFIDEYQDGDYIQEGILTAISGHSRDEYNMFMVGDVKQSIYGFRNARPEIFLSKYDLYPECPDINNLPENLKQVKVLLNENFRSRREVLDSVNFFFNQLMDKSMGGISYGDDTKLIEGIPHSKSPSDVRTEILIANAYDEDGDLESDKIDLEIAMTVSKIKELLNPDSPMQVLSEGNEQEYRDAKPSDIAILLRSVKGYGQKLYKALLAAGVPAYLEQAEGYYEATELRIMMSMLEVIDNRYQDIPLAAALVSPIGELDENEMLLAANKGKKGLDKKASLYDRCENFVNLYDKGELDTNNELIKNTKNHLSKFIERTENYRKLSKELSVKELIWHILNDTGYYIYASAMPDGDRRKANLDKLMNIASGFEKGDYKGVFSFIRYVSQIKLDKLDVGEASTLGSNSDVVRIMTMHKSKGLEYPIVFVSALGKKLNGSTNKDVTIVDNEYYVASDSIDDVNRFLIICEPKEAIKVLEREAQFAEEMRILYVAMTRAKEKLYLTAGITESLKGDIDKAIESIDKSSIKKNSKAADNESTGSQKTTNDIVKIRLPYNLRNNDKGFMFWIECCYSRVEELLPNNDIMVRREYSGKELEKLIKAEAAERGVQFATLVKEKGLENENNTLNCVSKLKEDMSYEYEYQEYTNLEAKLSISEIKKRMAVDPDTVVAIEEKTDVRNEIDIVTDEAGEKNISVNYCNSKKIEKDKTEFSGAERGTIIHHFMELFPFEGTLSKDEYVQENGAMADAHVYYIDCAKKARDELISRDIFTQEEAKVIPIDKIAVFLLDDLGQRMIKAAKRNELFREKGFTMAFPADEIFKVQAKTNDSVIVQGIIDVFFFENGKIVLADYKTDNASEEELVGHYWAQLKYYAETLEKLLARPVEEKYLYSFRNDKSIMVDVNQI